MSLMMRNDRCEFAAVRLRVPCNEQSIHCWALPQASVRLPTVTLKVRVLGPLVVERDGVPVAIGGAKSRLLLAVLVARQADGVTSDQLCDALWGATQPRTARTTVQSHLSRLRRILAPEIRIESHASRYSLVAPASTVDAGQFEDAIASAGPSASVAVGAELGAALGWWRGPAFAEMAENEWIWPEAVRLDELRLAATERWIDARLLADDDVDLIADLDRLVTVHPLRECFWRQLMLALYRSGRQAEALRRATQLSRLLRDELGLDLSPIARDLEHRILSDDPSLRAPTARPPVAVSRVLEPPTRLVGRDVDIERLNSLLSTQRLVTLVGPGGVGKTRLARRLGADYSATGRPAALIELAAVREPTSIAPAVATALDVQQRQHGSVEDTLTEFLRDREQLVVLDNCEHVIGAVARLAALLNTACPELRLLATSREPLGVPGETVYTVAPLGVADDDEIGDLAASPAVQLFCERATSARPDFVVTPPLMPVLVRLCRRLDGLPLAIELAAVRARSLGLEAMLERLDRRFSLLDAGPRHGDPRHHNLQNLVQWSYDLLAPDQQRLFARLSIFAGSFELDAVEAVCSLDDDPADVLFDLIDRSMVQVVSLDDERYHLLETLREFARDRLDDAGATKQIAQRHFDWFVDLAERAAAGLLGPDERQWNDRVEHDFDNVRAAHVFALRSGNVDGALRLVSSLCEFGLRRIRYEVTAWAQEAAHMDGADTHPLSPVALATGAYGHFVRGELDAAIGVALEAAASADRLDVDGGGLAERTLGNSYFYLGQTDEALLWMDRMVAGARAANDPARLAHALYMRSVAETSLGRSVRGAILAGESHAAAQSCRSPTALAQAGYALGLALESTEPAAGRAQLAAATELAAAAGNRWVEAFARTAVLSIDAGSGRSTEALQGYQEVIQTWYRGGDWVNQWLSIRHVFGILQRIGDDEAAAVIHGGLSAAGATYALPFEPADAARLRASVEVLHDRLGAERFDTLAARGATMPDRTLVSYTLERIGRAVLVVRESG